MDNISNSKDLKIIYIVYYKSIHINNKCNLYEIKFIYYHVKIIRIKMVL